MDATIGSRVEGLLLRLKGINEWIMNNPDTDPNMFEMTECLMEFANLVTYYTDKVFKEKNSNGFVFSSHAVMPVVYENNPIIVTLDQEMRLMMQLRGVSSIDGLNEKNVAAFPKRKLPNGLTFVDSNYFTNNPAAAQFLNNIHYCAITDSYQGEQRMDGHDYDIKKRTYTRLAAAHLFVFQEKCKNPDFVYDNEFEFNTIKYGIDVIEPQNIDNSMMAMFDYIKENSKFKDLENDTNFGQK